VADPVTPGGEERRRFAEQAVSLAGKKALYDHAVPSAGVFSEQVERGARGVDEATGPGALTHDECVFYAETVLRAAGSPSRDEAVGIDAREAWICPACPNITDPSGAKATCAGSVFLGTVHEPCPMKRVTVAPPDGVVAALEELVAAVSNEELPTYVCEGCGGPWPCPPSEWDSRHRRVLSTHVEDAATRARAALASLRKGDGDEESRASGECFFCGRSRTEHDAKTMACPPPASLSDGKDADG
jgi:hypothetical protein